MLKNASVQLTIIEGRITSLYDVALEYALFSQTMIWEHLLILLCQP